MVFPALQSLPFDKASLHAAYAAGLSIEDMLTETLRRIDAVRDPGIFLHLAPMGALLAAAAEIGPFDPIRKPLWGLPFAVKDNIDVRGMPTTAACPDFAYEPDADAFAVRRLRDAGAIPVGKTNLDQFATGLVGVRTPYPVPLNAIDPAIVPGGSSSGSGVIVAHGAVAFSLGTDTAGSGRVPAALNNIVGLKPSLGLISATGVVPACRTLDTISVFALTVGDAFAAMQAMAGHDPADAYSRSGANPQAWPLPKRFKIGVPDDATLTFDGDAVQEASYRQSLRKLEALGGEIVAIDFAPFQAVASLLYHGPWVAERYAAIRQQIEARPETLHPVTAKIIGSAAGFSAADAFDALYKLADLRRQLEPTIASVDLMCVPSIPTFYSVADLAADPVEPNTRLGTYTNFVNLLQMCGLAVPTRARSDGRPGSVTLLAAADRDGLLAAVGARLHAAEAPTLGATGWALPPADGPAPDVGPEEIAVALVGAHMQGLPLNSQVSGRGGRLLFEGETAPIYRLYSLAGGPPKRPGLVRQDAGGAAIALEVWAMPRTAFGDFMTEIPPPLGIGTVDLAGGRQVKGFLCEPAGLVGAEEITGFGGWRAFLASAKAS